ncbi:putative transcription factor bZIP family [Helianthus annuus]|nr:putative transcription factor bZIP family [Helianthus annuus]KAJ0944775.1 putative transcription factor bZIP family [Helianthus annuus]
MEMEGSVCSDLYRNTSEEMFIRTLMESSVGLPAPTMENLGFKNLSNNLRVDSEELFKSWLTTGENQGHSSTHNRPPRQLSRMLTDQASQQNCVPPQSPWVVDDASGDMNGHSVRGPAEKGLQGSNLYLAKAWFNSSQPMTRSRSSELRRKYVAMQNSQTTINIEAMHNESRLAVNQSKNDFSNPFNDLISTSNSSSSTFNGPQIDKVSSVVSMLKGSLERKKLENCVEKEVTANSLEYRTAQEVREVHLNDLIVGDINDGVLMQRLEGAMDADLEGFVAPTNLIQRNAGSREASQSESSADPHAISTGFEVSDGPSNSSQSQGVCHSPRKLFGNGKYTEMGSLAKDIREHMYNNFKEDHKHKGSLTQNGSVTSAASSGDPTKKRRVERSRKMAEAKGKTQTSATSSDMQSILKRCENLEKEVRSLKLNLAFMNRKDSEQTKQIEELQKQNEEMGDEKERLLEEIDRILSRQEKM